MELQTGWMYFIFQAAQEKSNTLLVCSIIKQQFLCLKSAFTPSLLQLNTATLVSLLSNNLYGNQKPV